MQLIDHVFHAPHSVLRLAYPQPRQFKHKSVQRGESFLASERLTQEELSQCDRATD